MPDSQRGLQPIYTFYSGAHIWFMITQSSYITQNGLSPECAPGYL